MKTKDYKSGLVRAVLLLLTFLTATQAWAQKQTSWTFSYTGTIQSFTASKAGIYELQVWGAQGGKQGSAGGLGGYATCRTTLAQGETIYIYVGGKGGDEAKNGGAGGWNGGGKGGAGWDLYNGVGGGGGATHISKVNNQVIGSGSGQCASLVGTDFIIVAGGGGGGSHVWTTPGVGGGTEGGKGTRCNGTNSYEENYSDNFYYSTSQSYGANGGNGSTGGWAAEGAGGGGGGYYGGTSNYAYGTFDAELQDAGGCGGNSAYNINFATNFSTTAGQREGNGQAQIVLLVSQDEMDEYVGKVLGSDGKMYKTVAAAQNAGTIASGVIAYWGVAGSVYGNRSDLRGIAISIGYPGNGSVYSWGNDWVSMYSTGNDLATMYATQTGAGAYTSQIGRGDKHKDCGGHPAISAAWDYNTARPSRASMWFLADVGQWNMIVKGLTGCNTNLNTTANSDLAYDKVNMKLNAAGATPLNNSNHWTVSEYEGNNHSEAWEYLPNGSLSPIEKTNERLVRPIFTFSSATPAVYTISYDANGGNGAPSAQTKDGGIDLNLSSTVPTRSGYTFVGWTVAQDGSGTVYPAGAAYNGNADATLYAQWTVAINGKLPGSFSVSATKKVCFSQGNLQYQGSTNSWRFATHQYNYIGNNAGNTAPSESQTEWMDLFGWGTSGWDNGNRNAYQPYSTSENVSDYGVKNPKSADETLTGEYANGDWGVYNSAQLGPGWRTMTRDEWRYLIYYRTTTGTVNGTSNAIYTNAKILTDGSGTDGLTYNICGVILFPDEFDGSASYSGVTWGTINNVSDWGTTCTTAGWEALEAAGCVFLPAAGSRSGTSVTSEGSWGVYWTSTASAVEYVDDLYIGPSTFSAWGGNYRHLGRSVRLASDTFDGTGTEENPYLISSTNDWNLLADNVNAGNTYAGKYFHLTDNISVTTMVGNSESHSFCGTFDGDGHTLTINYSNNSDYTAPFRYIQGATFKKLKVTGSITTSMNLAAGIAGLNTNASATFDQCVTDVAINSTSTTGVSPWGSYDYHSGLLARTNSANVTITDCVCGGSVNGSSDTQSFCAGLVGVAVSCTVSATRCLSTTSYTNVYCWNTICHSDGATRSADVFYFVNGNDINVGERVTTLLLADATYATALQAGRATKVWVQDPHTNQPMLVQFVEKTATLSQTVDNSSFLSTNDGVVYDITLGRTLNEGGWNTFCVPFDLNIPTGWVVRELGSSNFDSTTKLLTLNFTNASSIEAGHPYLVNVDATVANPTFNDVTISNTVTTTETAYADFVPVMNPTLVTGGDKTVLFVTGGNKLTYPSSTGNLNGFRAYFKLKEGAAAEVRAFTMNFDDETTSISEKEIVNSEKYATAPVFDLQGRKVSDGKWPKGMYIVNGKKVVIK